MKRAVTLATVIFVGLAVVFAVLAVIAKLFFAGDGFAQGLLLAIGASVFASGLTFFLIEIFSLREKKESEAKNILEVELTRR
jgi:hypothetical protein